MIKHLYKITTVILATLVLLSTFSFTVEKHYCGEFLMDVSFSGDAEDCGMTMNKTNAKKNCCKDEVHHIEGQDELQKHLLDDFNLEKQQFVLAFYASYKYVFTQQDDTKIQSSFFPPPDIQKDYQILHQTFLI